MYDSHDAVKPSVPLLTQRTQSLGRSRALVIDSALDDLKQLWKQPLAWK